MMKKHSIYFFCLLLSLVGAGTANADDTDIYLNPDRPGATPLVMFHIEYTSNLVSTICTGVTGVTADKLETECPELESLAGYLTDSDAEDGKLSSFEMIRATLVKVLSPLTGIKVGLMISHNEANTNRCGPPTGCSDGGYILKGFTSLTDHKAEFIQVLRDLPEPQGNLSHPNQNKEVYFELFRYLEGFSVLNAYNGWSDFGTDDTVKLGNAEDCTNNSREVDTVPCPASVDPDTTLEGTGTEELGPDETIISNGNYISPLTENCQKVFVINILDGSGNANNGADDEIAETYANEGMYITNIANDDSGFVQMLAWLNDVDLADGGPKTDPYDPTRTINCDDSTVVNCDLALNDQQNVTSYFLAKQDQQVNDQAVAGGTLRAYNLSEDPSDIQEKLDAMLNQIYSTSTTFVSASIPVNVFNRAEVLNNVFIALFQVDKNGAPYWTGDIKKLKLHVDTTNNDALDVIDANAVSAIGDDGRIKHTALTFWTRASGYDVVAADTTESEISGKDGRSVNRGGAGQKIPNFLSSRDGQGTINLDNNTAGRKLYTDYNNTLIDLTMSNIADIWPSIYAGGDWQNAYTNTLAVTLPDDTKRLTGVWDHDYNLAYSTGTCYAYNFGAGTNFLWAYPPCQIQLWVSDVMAYIRGADVFDGDNDGNRLETRRWIFGDPLHSRPYPINYGANAGHTESNPDIRLVAGSNDGFFRMIQNTNSSGTETGVENWAFMPREALGIQKRLMENVRDNTHTHPYGVDGEPVVYMLDNNKNGTIERPDSAGHNDKVYVYFGLRRGGKSYYALDVSNPDSPTFKWRITKTSGGDFDELGDTFSTPVVTTLDWGDGSKPVLIFGGGYSINKDTRGVVGTNDTEGNAIYVVNAETGALIWKAVYGTSIAAATSTTHKYTHPGLVDSIPSTMTVVDSTGDGNADRAYVGDTGGTVWRVDLNTNDITAWRLTKLLVAGRHYLEDNGQTATLADDRRFFHAPDFVPAQDDNGPFDAVVIGSGNRANPQSRSTEDFFYMIKDRDVHPLASDATDTWFVHDSNTATETLEDVTRDCLQEDVLNCSPYLYNGWKMQFETSEKSLASPFTLNGDIYFNTYLPWDYSDPAACGPEEGIGYAYRISLYNGNSVYNYDTVHGGEEADGNGGTTATELGMEDRRRKIASEGIPAESVYISYTENGVNVTCTMTPDFRCEETSQNAAWRTFWYKNEE